MSLTEAIKCGFSKYANFNGRARRSEYWWFTVFNTCIYSVGAILSSLTGVMAFSVITSLYILAVFLPMLACLVRRMHDIGRSGWYVLCVFIPVVGMFMMLIWMCTEGESGSNQYGANPKHHYIKN